MSLPCSATVKFCSHIGNKGCGTLTGATGKVGGVRMGVLGAALI